jgi:DNA-directed RNA polymerase omega subunit
MQKLADDLISLPIETNLKVSDTKFRLVHIASQRVRQLSLGVPIEVSTRSIKDTTIALEEAVAGKLRVLTGAEAITAKAEFLKQEERAKIEEQLSAKEEEIRKELSAYLSEAQDEEGVEAVADEDVADEEESSEAEAGSDEDEETKE